MHHDIVLKIEAYSNIYVIRAFLEKAGVIRANGRFIWPLMYVLIIFVIYLLYKLMPKKAYYILLILLAAQAVDISPLIKERLFKNQLKMLKYLKLNMKHINCIQMQYPEMVFHMN